MRFRPPSTTTSLNALPLINLALLVVALIALAVHFETTRASEREKLPGVQLARPPAPPKAPLVVEVVWPEVAADAPRGQPFVRIVQATAIREVAIDLLDVELQAPLRNESTAIVLRADNTIPAGIVQHVVQVCQQHGYRDFSLQELPTP